MKKLALALFALFLTGLTSQMALADNDLDNVKKVLNKLMPKAKPDSVMQSAIPGIYEVVMGAHVVYVSADGRYMVEGDMYDLKNRVNLTENKRQAGRVKAIDTIDEGSMIIFKPESGKVKHVITAFTDIDCGYCRKLHSQMKDYNQRGIEVRYVSYPRAGKNSSSYVKAKYVWCAVDRNKAMTFAKGGAKLEQLKALEQVKGKDCAAQIDKDMQVANDVGVSGTPTLVMADGKVLPGYVAPDRLLKYLDEEKNKTQK